jgi:hypothetical protein
MSLSRPSSTNNYNIEKANWPEFSITLSNIPLFEHTHIDPCMLNSSIRDALLEAADKHIPKRISKQLKSNSLPKHILNLINEIHKIRKKVRNGKEVHLKQFLIALPKK